MDRNSFLQMLQSSPSRLEDVIKQNPEFAWRNVNWLLLKTDATNRSILKDFFLGWSSPSDRGLVSLISTLIFLRDIEGLESVKRLFSSVPLAERSLDLLMCQADVHFLLGDFALAQKIYQYIEMENFFPEGAIAGKLALKIAQTAECLDANISQLREIIQIGIPIEKRKVTTSEVELIVFAHPTKKLKKFSHLAPPTVGLLSGLLDCLEGWRRQCKVSVYVDDHDDVEFCQNAMRACEKRGVYLEIRKRKGLKDQWLHAFSKVTADLIGIFEQDHIFTPQTPKIEEVIQVFNARPDLAHIRLNRRQNIAVRYDSYLFQDALDENTYVCRTSRFSNAPHFIRRSYYENFVKPQVFATSEFDGHNSGAGGIEEVINKGIMKLEKRYGSAVVARASGLGIFGPINHPAVVRHIGF